MACIWHTEVVHREDAPTSFHTRLPFDVNLPMEVPMADSPTKYVLVVTFATGKIEQLTLSNPRVDSFDHFLTIKHDQGELWFAKGSFHFLGLEKVT